MSLLGYLDSIVLTIDQQLLEAIAVDASYMHRVPTLIDAMAVVTENQKRRVSAATELPITPICTSYSMVRLQFAYNAVTNHNDIVTMYGLWERFTGGVQGIGIQKHGMVLRLLDTSYTTIAGVAGVAPISLARS